MPRSGVAISVPSAPASPSSDGAVAREVVGHDRGSAPGAAGVAGGCSAPPSDVEWPESRRRRRRSGGRGAGDARPVAREPTSGVMSNGAWAIVTAGASRTAAATKIREGAAGCGHGAGFPTGSGASTSRAAPIRRMR